MNEMSLGAVSGHFFPSQTGPAHVVFVFLIGNHVGQRGFFGHCLSTIFLTISIKQSGSSNEMYIVMFGNSITWLIVIIPCLLIWLCILWS